MACIGIAICSVKTCKKNEGCFYDRKRIIEEVEIKHGWKKCFREIDKTMKGNEYWEELIVILGYRDEK